MHRYTIVPAPPNLGLSPRGVEHLADALLALNLAAMLGVEVKEAAGMGEFSYSFSRDPETGYLNGPGIRDHALRLSGAVGAELESGRAAVVLGGDGSMLIGCALGLRARGRHALLFSVVRIIMAALAVLVVASLVGCGRAKSPGPEIKFVIVEKVSARAELDERLYAAVVKPRIESVQSFRVGGRIAARLADVGDHVTQGQVLASLDANDWGLNAQTVHGQLTAAIAQRDSARADLARFERLTGEKLMSAAELDRQQHAVAAAVGQVASLTAAAREADNKLSYAKLRADADGVVTQVTAEPGQVVSEGTPVITIARTAERELEFSIPEQRRDTIRLGQTVQVSLWSEPASRLEARVRWIAPSADVATRAFPVRASLVMWPQGLLFGMTASVRVPADASSDTRVTLPIAAVFDQGGAKAVWVVDPKARILRIAAVDVNALDGNRYVVRGGLRPGDLVVTAGVHRLRAGDHVAVFAGGEQPTQLAAQH